MFSMLVRRRELLLTSAAAYPDRAVPPAPPLPTVAFGKQRISRLIVGGNPVSANSHISGEVSREMMNYFTAANVKKLLAGCERSGINTWQSRGDSHIMRLLHEYRRDGGAIQWIAQTASELEDIPRHIRSLAAFGAIGIYHHGARTDAFWRAGKIDKVLELVKLMRDCGVRAGVGTHVPEVIDYIESKNWDVDFYMTCAYNLSRTPAEASQLAGHAVKGEYFRDADRLEMLERVRRTQAMPDIQGVRRRPPLRFPRKARGRHSACGALCEAFRRHGDRDVSQAQRAGCGELPRGV